MWNIHKNTDKTNKKKLNEAAENLYKPLVISQLLMRISLYHTFFNRFSGAPATSM